MPALPAAIAAYAAGTLTTAMVLNAVFQTAMVINGVMSARRAKKAARAAYEASLKDRAIVIRSSDAPRPIVYGRARASGPLAYVCSSGTYSENLHLVIPLAAHELDAIEDIWFNDESIGALDGSGWVTGGRYAKTRQEYATKVVTSLPGSGIITLDHTPDSVASVAVNTGTDNGYESVAFSVAGNQVTISSAYAGMWVNVTYYYTVATPLVRVKKFLGITAGERDTDLETASGGQWTANHLGKGVPRIHVTLVYDPDVFPSGLPNISVISRGKKVLDTRSSTTTWSTNPALIARDYIVDPLGFGESSAAINTSLVSAAANICDELVPGYETNTGVRVSSSIKRYECNGIISTDDDRIENLGILLSSMVGTSVYSGGSWLIRAGAYVSPVLSLTESDLAGGAIQVQPAASRRDLFNSVRGRFIDPSKGWQVDDFPTYASATYTAADNGESLWRDIVLGMETNAGRAQRLAKLTLHRARQGLTFSANFKLSAYRLQPGDTFYFSSDFFGWSSKVFRVVDRKLRQPGIISLVIQEEAAAVYDWDFSEDATPDPAPNTTLPDPRSVTPPTGFALTSVIRRRSDGVWTIGIKAIWDESTDVGVLRGGSFEIQLRNAFTGAIITTRVSGDSTEAIIAEAVNDGDIYHAGIRASNGVASSAWAYLSGYTVTGPTDAPNPPTAYLATAESFGIRLTWTQSTSFDVVEYQLREGSTWDSATDIGTVAGNTFFWKPSTAGTKSFWIKAVDAWGNVSTAVQADVTTSVPAVTGLALSVDGDSALLVWGAPASNYELADYEIRVGATYAGSTLLGYSRTTVYRTRISGVGTVRYWVAARDVAGNVGASTGVDLIVSVPLTPVIGSEVVDNFVLLRWQDCKTTLPVERYEVYRGATLVGDNGDGRFAVLFEQVAGLYTYGVKAYDSAGNASALGTVTANVSAPPDYVLRDNFDSTFSGTLTNGYVIDGAIHAPMYVETDAAHTTRIGVSTDSAAAGLGYDKWWEPGQASASYVEDFDLGVTVDPSTITVTPTLVEVQGTVTVTYSVKVSATGAFAGEETTYAGQQVYAGTTFRYVRVTITFASAGGDDLVQVTALNLKVATKLRTEAGVVNVTANPTTVNTSGEIDEILAIALTPAGTASRVAVYDYTSGTSFDVYLFNSSGAAVTGEVAWTVRGV